MYNIIVAFMYTVLPVCVLQHLQSLQEAQQHIMLFNQWKLYSCHATKLCGYMYRHASSPGSCEEHLLESNKRFQEFKSKLVTDGMAEY